MANKKNTIHKNLDPQTRFWMIGMAEWLETSFVEVLRLEPLLLETPMVERDLKNLKEAMNP